MPLTIFYDSQCPLCALEMQALKRRDPDNRLQLADIWEASTRDCYPQIDPAEAGRILHAIDDRGRLWLGLDVTAKAWSLVGVKRYNCLRWPLVRPIADVCYRWFARHRYSLSRLLTGRARLCDTGRCQTQKIAADSSNQQTR